MIVMDNLFCYMNDSSSRAVNGTGDIDHSEFPMYIHKHRYLLTNSGYYWLDLKSRARSEPPFYVKIVGGLDMIVKDNDYIYIGFGYSVGMDGAITTPSNNFGYNYCSNGLWWKNIGGEDFRYNYLFKITELRS